MSTVRIESVSASESTIESRVSYSRDLRRFFADDTLRVSYSVDVSDVPERLLSVPVLAHVCPVAWANGGDVEVACVDRTFRTALDAVRDAMVDLHPAFMEGGDVRADRVVDADDADRCPNSALLFSGGVDSLATFLRHREEDPHLISLRGWDVALDEDAAWNRTRRRIESFGDSYGVENVFVRSNMLSFLDTTMLDAHYQPHVEGTWLSAVAHGLALLGLCAPIAETERIGTVYLASTHWEGVSLPWGSHPAIDNRVRWAGTRARHDGYVLTRQEKLDLIADHVRDADADLSIRTCLYSESGGNCGACEKCYRTAVGLVLAGVDPNRYGYDLRPDDFPEIRRRLEDGDWILGADERHMWRDLQTHATRDLDGVPREARDFLDWLADADLDDLVSRGRPPARHRFLRAVARNTPYPVYASLYPVYAGLSRAIPTG